MSAQGFNVWALFRDGDFYRAFPTKRQATDEWVAVRPGSKHTWEMKVCTIKMRKRPEQEEK